MAEAAVVEGSPISRFFCHKCSVEIERLLPDYTCPFCTLGFIEQLEGGDDGATQDQRSYLPGGGMDIGGQDFTDINSDINILERPHDDFVRMYLDVPDFRVPGYVDRSGHRVERRNRDRMQYRRRQRPHLQHVERIMENFILNLSSFGLHLGNSQGGGVQPVLFLGNPGDYVWGRDGLDTIVTQLLNQMDGSGPPPLPRKQIDEIPVATVSQSQIDVKLQCSICWEDFELAEVVRQLPCKHVYHTPCIERWLELHGTCPICRQSLGDQSSAEANRDIVGPSLAALFRAANQSSHSRTPSASSSSTSTSDE